MASFCNRSELNTSAGLLLPSSLTPKLDLLLCYYMLWYVNLPFMIHEPTTHIHESASCQESLCDGAPTSVYEKGSRKIELDERKRNEQHDKQHDTI